MAGLYDLNTIPESVRLAMDMMIETHEAEIADLRRQLAKYERDHATMEALRRCEYPQKLEAFDSHRVYWHYWIQGEPTKSADDPADAVLLAAGERQEAKP